MDFPFRQICIENSSFSHNYSLILPTKYLAVYCLKKLNMKKSISLVILLFAICSFNLKAEIIEKTYYFSDYEITQSGDYHFISFENTQMAGQIGEPSLPYHAVSLLLPPGYSAESIEIIGEDENFISGEYQLYPRQASRPLSEESLGVFQKNQNIYNSDVQYPAKLYGEFSTEFLNGYSFVLSTFTPVKYNPAKGKISWYKKVTIRIKTKQDNKAIRALDNLKSSETILSKVNTLAQNPEMVKTYPQTNNRTDDDYDMMIITPSSFEESYNELIDFYIPRGIKAETVTTEYINTNISGQDMPEKIRNYIIQEYQDHGVEYILLGGDVEHVPYRGFYCYVQSGSGYEDNNIPADLYYSALDGTWNDDGDNRWGEIGEDDLLPDVSVARFTISDTVELNNMLHKTISYQDSPVLGELDQPLLAGEYLYSSPLTWGAQYLELLVGYHDDNGYETTGIPETDNYDTLYDRSASWSASQLLSEINEGKSFIHHCGHANTNYVMRLYDWDITNSNFSEVNGTTHNYTLVYTHGCICGAFDSNDCIGEKMVTIDNFAAAGAFNSRYGWFNEGQTEGPSAHIHREFIDALYNQKKGRVGEAHKISKIETSPWVNAPGQHEEGALRWCFYDCNMFGDPAMSVWTAEPINIDVVFENTIPICAGSTNISVTSNGEPVEGLNCVLKDGDVIYGTAVTDSIGNAAIFYDSTMVELGNAQLVISGYNCLPNIYEVVFIPCVGIIIEDFETGDFSAFEWEFYGDLPWTICDIDPYEGDFCTKSGAIGNSSTSELFIELEVLYEGDISFFRKVSSEDGCDYLKFYIDNDLQEAWSGEKDWAEVSYVVTSGIHTFRWVYDKNEDETGGSDCAWLDHIEFPPALNTISINENHKQEFAFNVYPNPCNDEFYIEFIKNDISNVQISIYNNTGQLMNNINSTIQGNGEMIINTSELKSGIYYLIIQSNDFSINEKIIIQ